MLLVCAPALQFFGMFPDHSPHERCGRALERKTWWRLWAPMLPSLLAFCVFVGWALAEPEESDETFFPYVFVAIAPFLLVAVRAAARSMRALLNREDAVARTVGLFRPRTIIAQALQIALDPGAAAATWEHERAHVRHRDPLRIWLAQIATDLQWPWPAARRRFQSWLQALEIARDEEARTWGIDGADLAAAVIEAARLEHQRREPRARLIGAGEALEERIARLFEPLAADSVRFDRRLRLALICAALLFALGIGIECGDTIVRSLPGVDISASDNTHRAGHTALVIIRKDHHAHCETGLSLDA